MAAEFEAWRARVGDALHAALPGAGTPPQRLHEAMRYAALGGGKRFRPLLVYAAGTAFGATEALLDPAAVAVELVHAYSLVHDDLPAMDDDELRRGRATVHVAFDEATAILVGDALQALAFEVIADAPLDGTLRARMLARLARDSGSRGMAGGQAVDLDSVGKQLDAEALGAMHGMKTGALIRCSVALGAMIAGCGEPRLAALDRFAGALGLAFQIRDDLLDVEGDDGALGKTAGKDAANNKPTYVSMLGIDGARAALEQQCEAMDTALDSLSGARLDALRALAGLAARRGH